MACGSNPPVVIIGAGPYGISIAAHLQNSGMCFRIFGKPMYRWRFQMPKGMFLKSEGCASNLSDPHRECTLAKYCASKGLPYSDWGRPVALDLFTEYALFFQQQLVPSVEELEVTRVDAVGDRFRLTLSTGGRITARQVIVATGMDYSAYVPAQLAHLPPELVSHSSECNDLSAYAGKDVAVIGGGQSAIETAALLNEQGTNVHLIVRKPELVWNDVPATGARSVYQRLRYPASNLGLGMELWLHCNAPMLFRHLPRRVRIDKVRSVLGPAGAWWLRDRVLGRLNVLTGHCVERAAAVNGRAELQVAGDNGSTTTLAVDHVIAATGYCFDLQRLPFLSEDVKTHLRSEHQRPVLSPDFESSVPGMYFTGYASATYFGPSMRFLEGADYTARRVCRHVSRTWRLHQPPAHLPVSQVQNAQGLS